MRRPNNPNHASYYDGHHHEYNFGFFLAVAGVDGSCRYFNGHLPGSRNDLNNYYSSDLYQNPMTYLGIGDELIADGIFARIESDRFIVLVCGVEGSNCNLCNYHAAQRKARSMLSIITLLKVAVGY